MTIAQWVTKPATVRVCGPYAGTAESVAEFAEFVGADNWATEPGGTGAEFWDSHRGRWMDVGIGRYLVERPAGRFVVTNDEDLRELYEPAPSAGVPQ